MNKVKQFCTQREHFLSFINKLFPKISIPFPASPGFPHISTMTDLAAVILFKMRWAMLAKHKYADLLNCSSFFYMLTLTTFYLPVAMTLSFPLGNYSAT